MLETFSGALEDIELYMVIKSIQYDILYSSYHPLNMSKMYDSDSGISIPVSELGYALPEMFEDSLVFVGETPRVYVFIRPTGR